MVLASSRFTSSPRSQMLWLSVIQSGCMMGSFLSNAH